MLSAKSIKNEIETQIRFILSWIPGGIGARVRYYFYKNRFQRLGRDVCILVGCTIRGEKNISLGNRVGIGINCFLYAGLDKGSEKIVIGENTTLNSNVMINADLKGEIIIGENVIIGPNVVMRTSGHRYEQKEIPIREQGHHPGTIVVKDGVWIGSNAVILPDVTVGHGAIVAAGAVVSKDVNDFEIVGGVPARMIGSRFDNLNRSNIQKD